MHKILKLFSTIAFEQQSSFTFFAVIMNNSEGETCKPFKIIFVHRHHKMVGTESTATVFRTQIFRLLRALKLPRLKKKNLVND